MSYKVLQYPISLKLQYRLMRAMFKGVPHMFVVALILWGSLLQHNLTKLIWGL